ncbi:MAG: menaquinone biosynthesis protein [Acidobacteria bacterium]|nr:menaquinone biosynthesis protein [Acidobacteriota bacterium]
MISFLNAAPLHYLLQFGPRFAWLEVIYRTPAESADALAAGGVDAALLPIIEFRKLTDLATVPSTGIVSPQRARSVLLVSRKPLRELSEVGITRDSRTSVALLQVILRSFMGKTCRFHPFSDIDNALALYDAALIIGDQAMLRDFSGYKIYDLAEMWHYHTGLPFVFARWGIRRQVFSPELEEYLLDSKRQGLANIPFIAREYSRRLGLDPSEIQAYLTQNLRYDIGEKEELALELFYRLHDELAGSSPIPGKD